MCFYCGAVEEHPDTRWCGECAPCTKMFESVHETELEENSVGYMEQHGLENVQDFIRHIKEGLESWRK